MKKKIIRDINLAFPCQQNWHEMKVDGGNRTCKKCASCIHDFTNTSAEELTQILDNSVGLICGRFKKSQLSEAFIKYAASTLIVTASFALPVLGQETTKSDSVNEASEQIEEEVFIGIIVEEQAVPKSGFEGFYEKISNELKYPDQLVEGGKVFIQFTVDKTGDVVDVEIIKGLNEVADKEALRTFLAVDEKFEPAKQRGKAVRMRMVLPISFDPKKDQDKK